MIYVYSTAAGLLYGAIMGGLKYIALWRRILTAKPGEGGGEKALYARLPLSYGINAATLIILFLVRDTMLPLNFTVTIIAAAVGLSVTGRFFSVRKVLEKVSPQSKVSAEISAATAEAACAANAQSAETAGTEERDND